MFTAELLHLFTDEQIQPSGFGCNLAFAVDLLPGMAACRRFLIGVPPGEMHRARRQAAIAFSHGFQPVGDAAAERRDTVIDDKGRLAAGRLYEIAHARQGFHVQERTVARDQYQVGEAGGAVIAWSLWRRAHQAAAQEAHIKSKMQL